MKLQVLAVRDRAVDAFGRPMFFPSNGAAIRAFGDEVNRQSPDNPYHEHPEDYDLYLLGIFDDETGHFHTDQPKQIAIGKDLITKKT